MFRMLLLIAGVVFVTTVSPLHVPKEVSHGSEYVLTPGHVTSA
jgi:hypothetical protein